MLLAALSLSAQAQDTQAQRLVVWMKSGEKVYFDLAEEPHTQFTADGLVKITTSTVETSYQRANILRYTFEGASTDIGQPKVSGTGFRQTSEGLDLYNLPAGTVCQLYDMSGRLLGTQKANGSQSTTSISLSGHPAGVYIVKIGDQSLKISKR